MLKIQFIRHAQSQANAGERTADPAHIALTDLGRQQAECVAATFKQAPDLLVVSPFLRAQQTAEFLLHRFPDVRHEVWAVQEFTYLDRERCRNTTTQERIPMARAFWEQNDPHLVDGEQSESFANLMARVDLMWRKLLEPCEGQSAVVVSHALTTYAALWHWLYPGDPSTPKSMKRFWNFMRSFPIPNASILNVRMDPEFWHGAVQTSHIPEALRVH